MILIKLLPQHIDILRVALTTNQDKAFLDLIGRVWIDKKK